MKKISYYISCILLGLFILSCEDQWDKHIESGDDDKVVSDLPLLEYIKENSEYAEFVTLLERVGLDSLFQKGMQYTLWLPTAESVEEVASLNDTLVRHFVMNHINLNSMYTSTFEPEMSIDLLSGKRVKMHADTDFSIGYRIENAGITKSNLICKDGVIHELDTCLIPIMSLYEKLESDPDYSDLLTLLKQFDKDVFKPELSTQTGVDDWGNLIYDSVFVTENQILIDGDIRKEDQSFTVFATPNVELQSRLSELYSNYEMVNGTAPKRSDSLDFEEWVVKSLIYDEVIKDYGVKENLYSVHEELWKCSKQIVNQTYTECSNGLFYEVEKLHFPVLLLMDKDGIRNNVNDMVDDEDTRDDFFQYEITNSASDSSFTAREQNMNGVICYNYSGLAGTDDNGDITGFDFSIYWNSFRILERPSTGEVDSLALASVMPGEYLVKASCYKTTAACKEDIEVYINGQSVGQFTGIDGEKNKTFHEKTLGTVTIEGTVATHVEFRFATVAVTKRKQRVMAPFHIELIPTENNY